MVGIDASIPLQGRVGQIEPDTNRLARVLALQGAANQNAVAQMAMQDAQENRVRQNKLREILAMGGGEDELVKGGFLSEAATLGKNRRESKKLDVETQGKEFELLKKRLEAGLQAGAALLNSQAPLSRASVVEALTPHVQSGVVDMKFATDFVKSLPQDDAGIRAALRRGMLSSMSAKEQLEAMTQKVDLKDTGKEIVPYNTNPNAGPLGPIAGAATMRKTTTPGEDQANALGYYNADKPSAVVVPEVGVYQFDPKAARTGRGQAFKPETGADGKPIRKSSEQEKAEAKQAVGSTKVIDVLDKADTDANGKPISAEDLVKIATGSYAGTGRDMVYRAVGATSPGAAANAQLKILQANIMLAQPRMEGPQSDRDVQLYRDAAASLGDSTVSEGEKLAALRTLRQLHAKYDTQKRPVNPQQPKAPAPAQPGTAAPGGIRVIGVSIEGN